ncbi:hypothetical protein [Cytobacillus depressus]|uniref:hypothetical protein n=1 Tax=Cytobacillus depressus TaxID=1602942 RepID=UPI001BA8B06A|nr:hypothetical protein [Cytobacillus depressus]
MEEIIFLIIFTIPLYLVLIWTYFNPEESILFGKRWMYKEEQELSEEVIRYTKFASLITIIGLPIILISFIIEISIFRLISVVTFFLVLIFGALKIFTIDNDSK